MACWKERLVTKSYGSFAVQRGLPALTWTARTTGPNRRKLLLFIILQHRPIDSSRLRCGGETHGRLPQSMLLDAESELIVPRPGRLLKPPKSKKAGFSGAFDDFSACVFMPADGNFDRRNGQMDYGAAVFTATEQT